MAALLVSVYVFYIQTQEKRPNVTATVIPYVFPDAKYLVGKVNNVGQTKVIVKDFELSTDRYGFGVERDPGKFYPPRPFPLVLEPGDGESYWVAMPKMVERLTAMGYSHRVRIVGCFRDAVDNLYCAAPYDFNIDEWSK